VDIEKGCSPSSDNSNLWANGASTPVIMLAVFVLALVNFFDMSESVKIALMSENCFNHWKEMIADAWQYELPKHPLLLLPCSPG